MMQLSENNSQTSKFPTFFILSEGSFVVFTGIWHLPVFSGGFMSVEATVL